MVLEFKFDETRWQHSMTIRHSLPSEKSQPFRFVNPHNNRLQKLVPFGPEGQKICGEVRRVIQNAERKALEWVAKESGVQLTKELLPNLRLIEQQVRASYPDTFDPFNALDDEQLMQLAANTCLFLLVVFTMLLGDNLGFPSQHLLLGHGRVNEDKELWLRSIFFVGNQVPFVMVDKLMESLSSLRDYRTRLRKHKPPSDLLEVTLFELLTSDSQSSTPPPSDVMHCLWTVIQKQLSVWTSTSGTASSLSEKGKFPNSRPGKVTVDSPSANTSSEIWLKLIANILNEYETVHELESKASKSLYGLVQSTNDVQAPLSHSQDIITEVKVEYLPKALKTHPNLRQREEIQSYKKWLVGILLLITAITVYCSYLQ